MNDSIMAIAFMLVCHSTVARAADAPVKVGNDPAARALAAGEQQKLFTLPEGFSIELVASEATGLPKPVSIAFDDAGRLWSGTATEYPRDKEPGIWKKPGKDRVGVIDAPHRREPQPVRTFADGLVMPLGVLPYGDGAFVAQGPEILFLADTDHDGKADRSTVLLKGFGVQDTHTLPHQLVRLPGGRIGFSQGVLNSGVVTDAAGRVHALNRTIIASITPQGTDLRVLGAGLNNIWAWAQTRAGRVFIHEANDWGYSLVPFEEDSSYPSFTETKMHPAAPMHPPTAEGLNLGGTGFSGIAVCEDRAGSFPAPWQGGLFVANPILGKIHTVTGDEGRDGVWSFKKREDLVACADPMFRPVSVAFGPDGCLYIADWYNRIISHNEVARDHPGRDKEHGRIWRVRHSSQPRADITDYTTLPTSQLPAALNSDSTWGMRAAWHQLAQRQDKSVVPALVRMLGDEQTPADVRIVALWSLEELAPFDAALWQKLFAQSDADLRREAVRALTTLKVPQSEAAPLLKTLAGETAWTVRYGVLRYFRRAEGRIAPETLAWLRAWSATPATTTKVKGPKGESLALDGSYQRAFQDFLLQLVETRTQLPVMAESKWSRVIATEPRPADLRLINDRVAAVKAMMPQADAGQGRILVQGMCLVCHTIGGDGAGFAPPLDGSASRDLDGMITAIVDPNAAIESVFRSYRIETRDGTVHEGFKQAEDRKTITLLQMGGAKQIVAIRDIKSAGYVEGKSMMPEMTKGMDPEVVAHIAAYLRSLK